VGKASCGSTKPNRGRRFIFIFLKRKQKRETYENNETNWTEQEELIEISIKFIVFSYKQQKTTTATKPKCHLKKAVAYKKEIP